MESTSLSKALGFTDEISTEEVERIVAAVDHYCAGSGTVEIELKEPHVDAETVQMHIEPVGRLAQIRSMIREGIGDVWGRENVPESAQGFCPHITLAYSNGVHSVRDIDQEISELPLPVSRFRVGAISLIKLNRDRRRYEWEDVATVPL